VATLLGPLALALPDRIEVVDFAEEVFPLEGRDAMRYTGNSPCFRYESSELIPPIVRSFKLTYFFHPFLESTVTFSFSGNGSLFSIEGHVRVETCSFR